LITSLARLANRLVPGRQNIAASLTGVFLGTFLGLCLIVWSSRTSPVVINSVYELKAGASHGGHIDIIFDIDRLRECPSETSRWLWTWVDRDGVRMRQYFPMPDTSANVTALGKNQHFILSLPLPVGIWPGDWFYFAKTIEHCSFLSSIFPPRTLVTPEIPIRIIDTP
jgi:hypothetical protein